MSIFSNNLDLKIYGKEIHIKFYEILDQCKIFHLWPSTKFFISYLLHFSSKFKGETILELGSGVGVLGIVKDKFYNIFKYFRLACF